MEIFLRMQCADIWIEDATLFALFCTMKWVNILFIHVSLHLVKKFWKVIKKS